MKWPMVRFDLLYAEPTRNGLYKSPEFHGSGLRIVNMKELFAFPFIGDQDMRRIEVSDSEVDKFTLKEGDLLFARRSLVEEGAGKCVLVIEHEEPMVFESSLIRARLSKHECQPRFYYYYFLSPIGANIIRSIVTGAAQKGIRGSELATINVHHPPLDTQRRIADILSAYDDLIANNTRRMALLEETMHILYREWCVRLHFPGHEHTPIVDGVPAGWEKKKIGIVLSELPRTTAIKKSEYLNEGALPTIDQGSDFIGGYTDQIDAIFSTPLPVVIFGDHTRIFKFVDFPFARGADGTQVLYPKTDICDVYYFYFALLHIDLSNYAYARHFKYLKEHEILIPSQSVQNHFLQQAMPTMKQIATLRLMNQQLLNARNLLLPRLMNGTITL